eukprot:344108-Alexandrium_andersonii.AAC.1
MPLAGAAAGHPAVFDCASSRRAEGQPSRRHPARGAPVPECLDTAVADATVVDVAQQGVAGATSRRVDGSARRGEHA